jgi:hypothetical protein
MSARGRLDSFCFIFLWLVAPSSRRYPAGADVIRDTETYSYSKTQCAAVYSDGAGMVYLLAVAAVIDSMCLCLCDSSHTRRDPDEYISRFIFFFLDFLLLLGYVQR